MLKWVYKNNNKNLHGGVSRKQVTNNSKKGGGANVNGRADRIEKVKICPWSPGRC